MQQKTLTVKTFFKKKLFDWDLARRIQVGSFKEMLFPKSAKKTILLGNFRNSAYQDSNLMDKSRIVQ